MAKLKQIKRTATFVAIGGFSRIINRLSRSVALFIGSWLGLLAWWVAGKDRHNIHRNLGLAFGESFPAQERDRIGRRFFINSSKNLIDILRFQKHFTPEITDLVETEGLEHWDQAFKRGKGMVGVTGHIGNFELMAAYLVSIGYPLGVIGRKMYDPRLDELLIGNRQALGLTNFATTDSPRHLVRWIREGNILGVLMDTDSHRVRSMYVPSFNRLSHTPVGHVALALKMQVPIVPIACLRTESDRYRIIAYPEIEYPPGKTSEEDIYAVTASCNQALDRIISSHPEQWIWVHNRWHTNPNL